MILFANDWRRYPDAIMDVQTRNRSFVDLAAKFKLMGVENHAFFLALHNPELQGVDPFDKDLTAKQCLLIAEECKENPWYYFREIARVPGESGEAARSVNANRGNIALWWSFFNHITFILIQIRQTGKSFSTDTLMTYLLNVATRDTSVNLLTKDDPVRRNNIKRLKNIAEELPYYLNPKTKADANNGEMITVKRLKNQYTTHVPQNDSKRAYAAARGLTSAIFHIDEGPFQPFISTALPAALGAMGAAVDAAKRSGSHYGVILTTTAGKKNDRDGAYMYEFVQESAEWTEAFYDAVDPEDLEKLVRARSPKGLYQVIATFNHRQLGYTDEWLRGVLELSKAKGEDADRDFFNKWTSGGASNPIDVNILGAIAKSQMDTKWSEISRMQGYITDWFVPESAVAHVMEKDHHVIGVDPSDAIGRDDISFIVTNSRTLETTATACINETNIMTFALWLVQFLVKHPNTTLILERRGSGSSILDILLHHLPMHGIDPFRRIYNTAVQEGEENRDRWLEVKQPGSRRNRDALIRYKKCFGFATSGGGVTSRTDLYSKTLQLAARRGKDLVRDKKLIKQIMGLINNNGRIDHAPGEHDDMVIGWLLNNWLLTEGKNLDFYGMDNTKLLAGVASDKPAMTREQMLHQTEQKEIRSRIDALFEQMVSERDENLIRRMEQELFVLDRRVVLEENEVYSMQQLLSKVKEERVKKRFDNRHLIGERKNNNNPFAQRDSYSSSYTW